MAVSSYTNGKKTFSHTMTIGGTELIVYFSVAMPEQDIDTFARMLSIKEKVIEFYACVIINDAAKPRTFISYKTKDGEVREMFNISTGLSAVGILKTFIK